MRIVFMGTPDFSVPALEALIAAGHDLAAVYTQPPRPAGRGKKDRPSPVQICAEQHGIEVRHPITLRDAQTQHDFLRLDADVAVVVAYGLLLPQAILDAPRHGCLNIHASLLPRWRGAAPIHRAIMAGDTQTGICIMQMDAGLDTGLVLLKEATQIDVEETTGLLHDRLSVIGAKLIVRVVAQLAMLTPQPQTPAGVTYAAKIKKSEARIDWHASAVDVDRQIRGLSPFPGAWCEVAGERVKLLGSRVVDGDGQPGQILREFVVACGVGSVQVTVAQREGKAALPVEELLRGWTLPGMVE